MARVFAFHKYRGKSKKREVKLLVQNRWYCCNDCGIKLFAVNEKASIEGVRIRCKMKRHNGHINNKVRIVCIEPNAIHDMEAFQGFIEKAHVSMNKGECESYNICKYCIESKKIKKSSPTPCADAFFLMYQKTQKKNIFSLRRVSLCP